MSNGKLFLETTLPEVLSEEELNECFKKMASGDLTIREYIIKHNIRYVLNQVMTNFVNTPYDMDELISVGILSLIKSVDTFDLKRGHFIAYCRMCIRNEILMFLRANRKNTLVESLDREIVDDNGAKMNLENLIIPTQVDPIERLLVEYDWENVKQIIHETITNLSDQDCQIVKLLFGFEGYPCTQVEISKRLHMSQSGLSRRVAKILRILQIQLEAKGIDMVVPATLENPTLILKPQGK